MVFRKKYVRILLVGDTGVGKTSIIVALTTEESPTMVPSKAHELYITGEVTCQNVPALVVDTCQEEQSESEIITEIENADVICVVFSLLDADSCTNIVNYWLPLIRKASNMTKPIVIIGNKADALPGPLSEMDREMYYLKDSFPEIEGYFRVSTHELSNIIETFQFTQKVVLLPTSPLINIENKTLTPFFERALSRIFRIFDPNASGIITWHEMLHFQKIVFKNLLHRQTLQEIRETISNSIPNGLTEDGFTLSGFMFIHQLFVMRGMRDSVWKVLHTFGYNSDLELDIEYLFPHFEIEPNEYVELTPSAFDFLKNLFHAYDKDKDGCLNKQEFLDVFTHFPTLPFSSQEIDLCENDSNNNLTLEGFLSLFICKAFKEPNEILCILSILGYNYGEWSSSFQGLQSFSRKGYQFHKDSLRNIFICYVFGPPKCGKSSVIRALQGQPISDTHEGIFEPLIIAKSIEDIKKNAFLLFVEIDWYQAKEYLYNDGFDIAIFLYDTTDYLSFKSVKDLQTLINRNIPSFIMGNKNDSNVVAQKCDIDPKEYCSKFCSFALKSCSCVSDKFSGFSSILFEIACLASNRKKNRSPGAIIYQVMTSPYLYIGGLVTLAIVALKKMQA